MEFFRKWNNVLKKQAVFKGESIRNFSEGIEFLVVGSAIKRNRFF